MKKALIRSHEGVGLACKSEGDGIYIQAPQEGNDIF